MLYYHAMKQHVLLFQSSIDKSWRDKFEGVSIFARSVGWQLHVIGADTPPRGSASSEPDHVTKLRLALRTADSKAFPRLMLQAVGSLVGM